MVSQETNFGRKMALITSPGPTIMPALPPVNAAPTVARDYAWLSCSPLVTDEIEQKKIQCIMPQRTLQTHLVGVGELDDEGHQGLDLLDLGQRLLGARKSALLQLLGQSAAHARLAALLPNEAAHEHAAAEGGGSAAGHSAAGATEQGRAAAEVLGLATAKTTEVETAPSQEGRAAAMIAAHCFIIILY